VIDPGLGIEIASLTASWVEAVTERQTVGRHVGDDGADVDVSQLVDTLGVRLGQNKVFRLTPVESALPGRLQVDAQFEPDRLLHRKLGGLGTLYDLCHRPAPAAWDHTTP
jgi:hypothetical protein